MRTLFTPRALCAAFALANVVLACEPADGDPNEGEGEGEGEDDRPPALGEPCGRTVACAAGLQCAGLLGDGVCAVDDDTCGRALDSACDADADCEPGLVCAALNSGGVNACLPPGGEDDRCGEWVECGSSRPCEDGLRCLATDLDGDASTCFDAERCWSDDECPEGEACETDGVDVPGTCRIP